ncbi:MAG: M20/M25/M40 family metallo-hydrolase [Clostridiales bacterium]|nr:M20/M25/M40 family metallo-hydrolase [Candidatus Crickella caballi]
MDFKKIVMPERIREIGNIKGIMPEKKVSEYVPAIDSIREAEYAEKLARMVRYETVSYPDTDQREKFLGFHKVLEELFPLVHSSLEKTEIDGNLLFFWKGNSSEKPMVLMAHQDVVPAEGEWEHEPFSGDIVDGVIWGRGTADTKCSLMAIFQGVEELLKAGFVPANDVYISTSCTEEVNGDGCPKLVAELERRGVKPYLVCDEGGAIVEEPISGIPGYYAMIGVLEKGIGNVCFTAKSNGGHSSYPPKNSPIARLAGFVTEMEKNSPLKADFEPEVEAMFSTLAPYGPAYMRLLFGNLELNKPLLKKLLPEISPQAGALLKTTIAFTMQSGSDALNVLPQEAKLYANMRFIPHQALEESLAAVKKVADKYDLETEFISGNDCCEPVDITSDAYKLVESVIGRVFPKLPVCPYVMTGGTDAKFYQKICDACIRFSPVLYGPAQMKGMHGINECLDICSLPGAVDFYKTIIEMNS